MPFWRSGETRVQCCRGLLVGIDALACILAIGLDGSVSLFSIFVGSDALACILAIGLNEKCNIVVDIWLELMLSLAFWRWG